MTAPRSFSLFDRILGAEHRKKAEHEAELGLTKPPKIPKPRHKVTPKPQARIHMRVEVPPRFTGAAALTAEREGSTTEEVGSRWLKHIALTETPPDMIPEVQVAVKIAIGGTFSREMIEELEGIAKTIGVHPGCLAAQYIREGLAAEKAREDSPK
jgi:hypothetical protein